VPINLLTDISNIQVIIRYYTALDIGIKFFWSNPVYAMLKCDAEARSWLDL